MFLPRWKKRNVTTEPLVPEDPPSREGDEEEGKRPRGSKGRGMKLPPARKHHVDFPPQWREKQCVMITWNYYSIATLILLFFWPYGAILGIVGSSCYTCHCCAPRENAKGMAAAFIIHAIAFFALCVDIISVVVLIAIGTYYLIADCPFAEDLCDVRSVIGLCVYGGAILTFLRFIMALTVFLGMRDYRREIIREELLEKRLQDEIEERFKEYQRRRRQTKESTSQAEAGPSSSK